MSAQEGWRAGRKEEEVDITARRAVSSAVKAESSAFVRRQAREKRNEQAKNDAEIRQAENRFADAQSEIDGLKRQLADETRARELAERDVANMSSQVRELRAENGRLREDFGKAKVEADNAKARVAAIEQAGRDAEDQRARDARLETIRSNEGALISSLKRFGTVAKTDRGNRGHTGRNLLERTASGVVRADSERSADLAGRIARRKSGLQGSDRIAHGRDG